MMACCWRWPRESLDAGIGVLDGELPDSLEVTPLLDDALVAVVNRQDHAGNAEEAISWQELTHRDIALFARGNVSRQVNGLAQSQLPELKPRYTTDYVETLHGLVRSGLAIAILPRLYTAHLCDPQLKVVDLHQPVLSRTLALMWAKGLSRSTRIDEGRALLRSTIIEQLGSQHG